MRARSGVLAILAAGVVAGLSCREPTRAASAGGVALAVAAPPAVLQALDSGRVLVRGPTNRNVSAAPGQTVTIDNLTPGTYSVALEGFSVSDVAWFGQTSGITVVAGQNTPASVDFKPFQAVAPVFSDAFWIGTQVPVNIAGVPGAASYRVEWSPDSTFPGGGTAVPTTAQSVQITVPTYDVYFVRIRAVDPFGGIGVPSPATRIQVVQAGPAKELVFTVQPTTPPAVAGFDIFPSPIVVAQDSLGNAAVDFVGDVTLSISPGTGTPGTVLQGGTTATATAGVTSFGSVFIDSAGVGYTLTATASGLKSGTSQAFNVVPRLEFITQPQTTLARGIIPPIQVVAQDGGDHTVPGFTDSIRIAISSGSGALGATLSGTVEQAAVAGAVTFNDLSIDALGTDYTLTITAATGNSYGGADPALSVAFDVTLQFVFATQPTGSGNYSNLTPAVQVAAHNGLGAAEPTFAGDITVALAPGTGAPGASLLGATTGTATAGVATFPTLNVDLPGAGYRLQALGDPMAGLLGDNSAAFDITCATDCWTSQAPLPTSRNSLGVGAVGGLVYAIAGQDINGSATDVVQAYDPMADSWTMRAPTPFLRSAFGVGLVSRTLYAVGGYGGGPGADSVMAYAVMADSWILLAPIPTPRTNVGVGVVDSILYVVGGNNGADLAIVEAFDPIADTWSTNRQPMSVARNGPGVGVINGMLYAVGGDTSQAVEAYDPVNDRWSLKAPLPFPLGGGAVGVVNGLLYAVGGSGETSVYDPQTDTWTPRAPLPTPRVRFGIGVMNGLLYVVGGHDGTSAVGDVEAYHP